MQNAKTKYKKKCAILSNSRKVAETTAKCQKLTHTKSNESARLAHSISNIVNMNKNFSMRFEIYVQ